MDADKYKKNNHGEWYYFVDPEQAKAAHRRNVHACKSFVKFRHIKDHQIEIHAPGGKCSKRLRASGDSEPKEILEIGINSIPRSTPSDVVVHYSGTRSVVSGYPCIPLFSVAEMISHSFYDYGFSRSFT